MESQRLIRPHSKSRRGCLNCKARRVKCQETRPSPCYNCSSRGLVCAYPSADQLIRRRRYATRETSHNSLENATISKNDNDTSGKSLASISHLSPEIFTGDDLRFLHHFLLMAYPHLPFGSENLWKTSLPAYAHECPHLMHSILSLGASHLASISPRPEKYTPLALEHQGRALRHLRDALAKVNQCSKTDLDLILATTYALTFQANCMTDGLVDFAVMVRGCGVVTRQILHQYQRSEMFHHIMPDDTFARVCSQLPLTPCCDIEVLDMCIRTLGDIQPLLQTKSHLVTYHVILNTYRGLKDSARKGFIALTEIYTSWEHMVHQEFMDFVDPRNDISRMLLLHYVCITIMMKPVYIMLRPALRELPESLVNHHWGVRIYQSLPAGLRGLVTWQYHLIITDKARVEARDTTF